MANTYPAFTAYLAPDLMPELMSGDFSNDVAEQLLTASAVADELPIISASSRHGGIGADVGTIASCLELSHLHFLCGEPWNAPGRRCAYLLRAADLKGAEADISAFFAAATKAPDDWGARLGGNRRTVEDALAAAEVASVPSFHDDGLTLVAFFSYLRTLAHYCAYALAHGGALVHVQWGDS